MERGTNRQREMERKCGNERKRPLRQFIPQTPNVHLATLHVDPAEDSTRTTNTRLAITNTLVIRRPTISLVSSFVVTGDAMEWEMVGHDLETGPEAETGGGTLSMLGSEWEVSLACEVPPAESLMPGHRTIPEVRRARAG